jgi:hypothetical protein
MVPRLALTFALAALVCPAAAMAQSSVLPDVDSAAPAHVAYVDGAASLEREGRTENAPLNMPLLSGDRLRTGDGRVEVLFPDGSTLHLDARTTIDVQSDELVRLIDGRVRLNILGAGERSSLTYRVDSPAGSARITQAGEYRIALLHGEEETQLELAVLRGAAEVFTDQGTTPVRAGERAYASAGLAPSYAYAYNSATWDTFDRWSENRRDTRLGVSAQYLPPEMRTYSSVLDESGDWRYAQPYGYVWYPRVVADWRPYYYGRWASYPRYGWTWIGADRFAWPTHHYGRWGVSAGVWFWIPGSRWAPAYVSWGYAPGYTSWCPLGFDNRAVISLNIFNGGSRYYPSRGWTSISNSYFGRDYVHHRAVNWDRVDRGRRPTFAERGRAPGLGRDLAVGRSPIGTQRTAADFPGNGAGRSATPIRSAGSRDAAPQPGVTRGIAQGDGRPVARGAMTPANSAPGARRGQQSSRDTAAPRYVNRGDEIVRSPTERPTAPRQSAAPGIGPQSGPVRDGYAAPRQQAPAAAPQGGFPARDGEAMPRRTAPENAARPVDPRIDVRSDPRSAQPRAYAPGVAQPRTSDPRAETQGGPGRVDPRRTDAPVYRPGYDARPRGPGGYESRQNDQPARQAPSSAPGGREAVGRAEPVRPAPSGGHVEGHQAPPERAAPRGGSRETAAPRDAGRPAPSGGGASRRGGRGGS